MDKFWQIDFSEEALTSVDIIDNQHKEIALFSNKLFDMSIDINTKDEELIEAIQLTRKAMVKHFSDEIKYYEENNLPDIDLKEHAVLHGKMIAYFDELETKNYSLVVKALMVNQLGYHYLTKHLFVEDQKCLDFIKIKAETNM